MIVVQPDQKVLSYLGRALRMGHSAIKQDTTQAQLLAAWGLNKLFAASNTTTTE
ncbi:hypothetical protein [Kaarinaea lacus]